ncbi:superoxide dismutase family protein [Nonomuraea turkmeniaca]|uniref:Superoxide dismutase family protein n=1 Tax=Nonomuraea turkmeniaca TaxID=103838 RepID=A0A5S4FGC2_9ACTN|nr:superoxide dismutase family protein [Nonomuraea turkmeniaca]TMR18265.1 superoxide dismutase family protein [Nonomuraea turkmeniaca]
MRVPAFLLILLAAAGVGACAGPSAPLQNAPARGASPDGQVTLSGAGDFTPADTDAIVYDRKLVPEGAQASVSVESSGGQTRTSLVVEGLLPSRTYGAHLHTKPCGKKPNDSGPHYQHHAGKIDPVSEVWLDITTDGEGTGRSSARNDWVLAPDRLPGSLVIHAKPTVTSGPQAGQAGDRVACLTLS